MPIYPAKEDKIALLVIKKMQILFKYLSFLNVFLKKKALILLETTNLNQHAIELKKSQQLFYRSIYSLGLVELKMLKTYIKTNLVNSFIYSLRSSASTSIFFIRKSNNSF